MNTLGLTVSLAKLARIPPSVASSANPIDSHVTVTGFADSQTGQRKPGAVSKQGAQKIARPGAQRHPDAELARSLRDGE